ncbi:MAG: methionyl-tRNA formyltransferase [Patescibacteria group bacterium]|nr:methionyl-tRNA formyltransferase [Patescibacteria group bacterium]MDE1944451.1 methionyl-tRNA formyltransferase [Patescibacteria group bacterium]MDE2057666.1 methionyl-tRNA formyltransferase [Patescibacteria group bacterium]
MSQPLKFAYFGTPAVAATTLERLLAAGMRPLLVVTNPDAPAGRGRELTPSATRAVAERHGIPLLTPSALDAAAIGAIKGYGADLAVVVAYGKIFPQALIDAFPMGAINVHYSLLPRWRGASPMESALLAGDLETGVTIQQMALAMDAGDILAQESTTIGTEETARELRPRLISMGASMLVELLPRLTAGEVTRTPQDHALATRAKKFAKADGELSLDGDPLENWRKYRAYADTIGTYFFRDGVRYKITAASLKNGRFTVERIIPEGKKETDWQG